VNVYVSKAGKDYQLEARSIVGRRDPIREPVSIRLELHPPDARRRDIDNILKSLFDSLVFARVIEDDSLVHQLTMKRLQPRARGSVVVHVCTAGAAEFELV
jgi:crossover junction endodeoxyribonuclease RusA